MQIREFKCPDDFDAVTRLWLTAGLHNPSMDSLEQLREVSMRNPGLFLVGEEPGGEIVASVIGTFDGRRGYLYHVAVHPSHRRKGYGTAILWEVERRLWAVGAARIRFMVGLENDEAVAFYEGLGFETDDRGVSMSKKRPGA